ncbi:PREDICTED: GPI ethanolamine phosphate transferase 1 [Dufourea novaeangliae]|uniref:GPI ethanolamine phosphate transferase 1 n=1 Tax=Dufourea novaeangliae TaxID=178035 RepID=UPI0007674D87|nr:PREDICTED: GPI ethanolamine phosphate transferase 1 [Dufourea novaeangliae]
MRSMKSYFLAKEMYDNRFSRMNHNYAFIIWGVLMHLILLWGVLDVNFHSPIIADLPSVEVLKNAPAKRLILFVADGLRFRTFIEESPNFLKYVMSDKGVWGVSHTRMPTESRPGIVAICAGLYEDPSAIFKGWKENPVDFDSIFNQSQFSWAWGSPDIIPIFTKDAKDNIRGDSYPPEWQDFDIMKGQIWRLDSWVFDKYLNWLREEAHKVKHSDRVILFLHLLGCDTTGHTAKPYSREYTDNVNYVDRKIEEVVQMTENFFGDNATAYVFTADHGMTDWGSHGSGSTDETETPLITWGAGINRLNSRQDVEQVDITPLISSLIGAPVPTNNEGVLPWQYLNATNLKYMNNALLNNLKQLTHQVKANREMNCEDNGFADWREAQLYNKISVLEKYLTTDSRGRLKETVDTIELAKESLLYFRQYQRSRFLIYLSTMWLGWIVLLFVKIAGRERLTINRLILWVADVAFVCILITIFIMHKVSDCRNWRLPCYASLSVISFWLAIRSIIRNSVNLKMKNSKRVWIDFTVIILLLATMFMGLIHRSALSIGMLSTAIIQRIVFKNARNLFWTALSLAIFPLLPVVEPYPRVYIVLLSICIMIAIVAVKIPSKYKKAIEISRLIITGLTYFEVIDGRRWISWALLFTTPLHICTYSTKLEKRMDGVILGLFCPLALLSASYEPFFFVFLAIHLSYWPRTNTYFSQSHQSTKKSLTREELLKASIFMLYTLLCFFGTGNMASISSFDPSWTRHFITVFSPFIMFSLILLKISIPLMLVGCVSHMIGSSNIFLAVLLLGDCLSLPFVYCVTPEGSWLDIGSAISRFTIAISLPCLLLFLYYISYPLMTFSLYTLKVRMLLEKKHIV